MARTVNLGDVTGMQAAMVASLNEMAKLQVGSSFHYDAGTSEYALTFTNLSGSGAGPTAAAIAAANEWMVKYRAHLADAIAHKEADAAPALTEATDLTTACTLATAIKGDYNTHIGSTTYHANADATNSIAAADATDLASLQALLNEAKNTTGFNQHIASAPAVASLRIVPM